MNHLRAQIIVIRRPEDSHTGGELLDSIIQKYRRDNTMISSTLQRIQPIRLLRIVKCANETARAVEPGDTSWLYLLLHLSEARYTQLSKPTTEVAQRRH